VITKILSEVTLELIGFLIPIAFGLVIYLTGKKLFKNA